MNYTTLLLRFACTATLAAGLVAACDLPQKSVGDEPGDETGAGSCEPGDQQPADDGCNTCTCQDDGTTWACTEIACDPDQPIDPNGKCEPGDAAPAPDGCNTCTCQDDGTWACTLLGCPGTTGGGVDPTGADTDGTGTGGTGTGGLEPGAPFDSDLLTVCEPSVPKDELWINAAAIEGDQLHVTLQHGGGCEMHLYGLCWDGSVGESEPPQVWLEVAHDGMGDLCEALLTTDETFDLSPLAELGAETVIINLAGWDTPLQYEIP